MEAATVAVRSTGDGIAAGDEVAGGDGVAVGEGSALEAGETAGLAWTGDCEPPDAEHAASTRPRRATKVTGAIARADGNDEPAAKATGRDEMRFEMDGCGGGSEVTCPT
jgi:hypothetical protein